MIEVGEYIRTKAGLIVKATEYRLREIPEEILEDIKTHSKNIIDLIEVGDIVNYTFWEEPDDFTVFCEMIIDVQQLQQFKLEIKEECITLNSILTYEQYEQNCYKVGDII